MIACQEGSCEIVEALIHKGVEVNAVDNVSFYSFRILKILKILFFRIIGLLC